MTTPEDLIRLASADDVVGEWRDAAVHGPGSWLFDQQWCRNYLLKVVESAKLGVDTDTFRPYNGEVNERQEARK